jgi:hypothetical protein
MMTFGYTSPSSGLLQGEPGLGGKATCQKWLHLFLPSDFLVRKNEHQNVSTPVEVACKFIS